MFPIIDAEDAKVFLTPTFCIYHPALWERGTYVPPAVKQAEYVSFHSDQSNRNQPLMINSAHPVITKTSLCCKQVPAVRSGQKI